MLLSHLVGEIKSGIELLENLTDEVYLSPSGRNGSISAHFRHNIEIIKAVFIGAKKGRVDYCARERDLTLERDRQAAIAAFRALIAATEDIHSVSLSLPLLVRSEVAPNVETGSSFGRELEYVISHTVHHHALIGERLRASGIDIDPMFGVAASTKRYWEKAG